MKIIQEKLDKEIYIDIVMASDELHATIQGQMIASEFYLGNQEVYLVVRRSNEGEENAIKKR